jgi:hypothetical protein
VEVVGVGDFPGLPLALVVGVVDEGGVPLALVEGVVDHGGVPLATAGGCCACWVRYEAWKVKKLNIRLGLCSVSLK